MVLKLSIREHIYQDTALYWSKALTIYRAYQQAPQAQKDDICSETRDDTFMLLDALAPFQRFVGKDHWWTAGELHKIIMNRFSEIGSDLRDILPTYNYQTSVKLGRFLSRYKNVRSQHYKLENEYKDQNRYLLVSDKPLRTVTIPNYSSKIVNSEIESHIVITQFG